MRNNLNDRLKRMEQWWRQPPDTPVVVICVDDGETLMRCQVGDEWVAPDVPDALPAGVPVIRLRRVAAAGPAAGAEVGAASARGRCAAGGQVMREATNRTKADQTGDRDAGRAARSIGISPGSPPWSRHAGFACGGRDETAG